MRTVVSGERPPEVKALIERRCALGHDMFDEVWEGEYHVAPAPHPWHGVLDQQVAVAFQQAVEAAGMTMSGPFDLDDPLDHQVPDRGIHCVVPATIWVPTAALVVEVLSPDDKSWKKLRFYAAHDVDEVVIVDLEARALTWLTRVGDGYEEIDHSGLLGIPVARIAASIAFPAPPP